MATQKRKREVIDLTGDDDDDASKKKQKKDVIDLTIDEDGSPRRGLYEFLDTPALDFGQRPSWLLVIDYEATCDEPRQKYAQEIIEFPIVAVNVATGDLGPRFRSFVKPTEQNVSKFCTDLTGIKQRDVDAAPTLGEVLVQVDKWLRQTKLQNFAFASDAGDLKGFLHSECRRKGITKPSYYDRWVNVTKHLKMFYPNARGNLEEKVHRVGLTFKGRPHCGADDAYNIAMLAKLLITKTACSLAINDGINQHLHQPPPGPWGGSSRGHHRTSGRRFHGGSSRRHHRGHHRTNHHNNHRDGSGDHHRRDRKRLHFSFA